MITILVGKDGRPSMRKVFAQMKSDASLLVRRRITKKNKEWLRVYENGNAEKFKKQPIGTLTMEGKKFIRWGNRIETPTDKGTIVYNKSEAVANATDKKLSRELFIKGEVRTPKLVTPDNIQAGQYPVIARPSRHAKGKNFVILRTIEEFRTHYRTNSPNGWYYSEFINKTREFRVHCAHGKVLSVMEKTPSEDSIAWNRAITDEPFVRLNQSQYPYDVCAQALKAVTVLGLDFAGVDVIALPNGKKKKATGEDLLEGYVLEVNTSPTLNSSDFVSEQYAKYFDWLDRLDKRRDHWDYTKFESAVSFAWKQFQLMDQPAPEKTTN